MAFCHPHHDLLTFLPTYLPPTYLPAYLRTYLRTYLPGVASEAAAAPGRHAQAPRHPSSTLGLVHVIAACFSVPPPRGTWQTRGHHALASRPAIAAIHTPRTSRDSSKLPTCLPICHHSSTSTMTMAACSRCLRHWLSQPRNFDRVDSWIR